LPLSSKVWKVKRASPGAIASRNFLALLLVAYGHGLCASELR
jgi:hypothetical protein